MKSKINLALAAVGLMLALCGCSEYVTPAGNSGGNAADLSSPTQPGTASTNWPPPSQLQNLLSAQSDTKPAAHFPTSIAVARIQASGYDSPGCDIWGRGKFCIVTTRGIEIEDPTLMQKWKSLPKVLDVGPVNHMLLESDYLSSDLDLRTAAARMHADMLLIYTFDTSTYTADQALPLSIVTLGLAPDNSTRVVTTASAILLDTHSGYLYGAAEATAHDDGLTTSWTTAPALESARQKTEKAAFKDLAGQIQALWLGVAKDYANPN